MSDLLTRQQVERMGEHLCEENLSGVAGKILAHDAALRQQLAKAWEEAAQAVHWAGRGASLCSCALLRSNISRGV